MGAILKRLAQKLGLNRDTLKSVIYLGLTIGVYALIGLISFTDASFDLEFRSNTSYYINLGLTMLASLIVFYLAWQMSKTKNMKDKIIVDEEDIIRAYGHTIQLEGEYSKFKDYLKTRNKERRLDAYKDYLLRKIERTRNEIKRDQYEQIYEKVKNNIDARIPYFIQIEEYTYGNIVIGFQRSKKDDGVKYSGVEGLIMSVLPALTFTIIGVALILGISLNVKDSPLNQVKNFLTLLFTITTYLIRGLNFGDQSVMVVYKSRLENRQNVIKEYFQRSGKDIHCYINDNYKYLAEITKNEEKVEENNG